MAHELIPDQDNSFLELGRIIEENFYKRESKYYQVENMKIDLVRKEKEYLLIGEVKKSSRYEKSMVMQLVFYLKKLKEFGLNVIGEVLIPKERKIIRVELNEDYEKELEKSINDIKSIIQLEKPPKLEKNKFCKNCAYREFCWSWKE